MDGQAGAVYVRELTHHYGPRRALDAVALTVGRGEIFGLLGPNGGGKTTLFRILATLVLPQQGQVRVMGMDVRQSAALIRRRLGVVFQRPSLDLRLTAWENLRHQGHLYGLSGASLRSRGERALARFNLTDRRNDRAQLLSGGLRRRLELAKGLLHSPDLLVFDEPSMGLDPGARRALWEDLERLRKEDGTTVVLTTHFLEEAERCDRVAILAGGCVIAEGTPDGLRGEVGGDVVTLTGGDPVKLREAVLNVCGLDGIVVDDTVRLESPGAQALIPDLYLHLRDRLTRVSVSRPSLEDVFIRKTGRHFEEKAE